MIRIKKEDKIFSMSSKNTPVAKASPGEIIEFDIFDGFQGQLTSNDQSMDSLNWNETNPATGPLFIEGAEVGDILKVHIKKIEVDTQGVTTAIPNAGLFGDEVTKGEVKIVSIINNHVQFNENISIPINPMIGVIGVAPKEGSIPCGTPGSHGGNMDNKKIVENSILYFPVNVCGALLSMGDLHAVMGDGEIMVTGIEIGGKVVVEVDVIKNTNITNPILENEKQYCVIASHKDLLEAIKIATKEMQKIVMDKLNLSFNESGMLLSAVGDVEICQVVDPLLTVRFCLSKKYLKSIF